MSVETQIFSIPNKDKTVLKHIISVDVLPFDLEADILDLNLTFALIVQIKMIKKANSFLKDIGSQKAFDIATIQPILDFLVDPKDFPTEVQLKAFFELEKELSGFDRQVEIFTQKGFYLDFPFDLFALLLGVDHDTINIAKSKDAPNPQSDLWLQYDNICDEMCGYLIGRNTYDEMCILTKKFIKRWDSVYH